MRAASRGLNLSFSCGLTVVLLLNAPFTLKAAYLLNIDSENVTHSTWGLAASGERLTANKPEQSMDKLGMLPPSTENDQTNSQQQLTKPHGFDGDRDSVTTKMGEFGNESELQSEYGSKSEVIYDEPEKNRRKSLNTTSHVTEVTQPKFQNLNDKDGAVQNNQHLPGIKTTATDQTVVETIRIPVPGNTENGRANAGTGAKEDGSLDANSTGTTTQSSHVLQSDSKPPTPFEKQHTNWEQPLAKSLWSDGNHSLTTTRTDEMSSTPEILTTQENRAESLGETDIQRRAEDRDADTTTDQTETTRRYKPATENNSSTDIRTAVQDYQILDVPQNITRQLAHNNDTEASRTSSQQNTNANIPEKEIYRRECPSYGEVLVICSLLSILIDSAMVLAWFSLMYWKPKINYICSP